MAMPTIPQVPQNFDPNFPVGAPPQLGLQPAISAEQYAPQQFQAPPQQYAQMPQQFQAPPQQYAQMPQQFQAPPMPAAPPMLQQAPPQQPATASEDDEDGSVMSVAQIKEWVHTASLADLQQKLAEEKAGKNRKTAVNAIEEVISKFTVGSQQGSQVQVSTKHPNQGGVTFGISGLTFEQLTVIKNSLGL